MSEIKFINVESTESKMDCQICNDRELTYYLNCELKDMYFKIGICKNCYIQSFNF